MSFLTDIGKLIWPSSQEQPSSDNGEGASAGESSSQTITMQVTEAEQALLEDLRGEFNHDVRALLLAYTGLTEADLVQMQAIHSTPPEAQLRKLLNDLVPESAKLSTFLFRIISAYRKFEKIDQGSWLDTDPSHHAKAIRRIASGKLDTYEDLNSLALQSFFLRSKLS